VSKEWRLFARDLSAPPFTAYLLAISGKQGDLEGRMFSRGVVTEGHPGNAMFRHLVCERRPEGLVAG
jgi:hypothetical protein